MVTSAPQPSRQRIVTKLDMLAGVKPVEKPANAVATNDAEKGKPYRPFDVLADGHWDCIQAGEQHL